MKASSLSRAAVIGTGFALTACATITYPNGTKVTVPTLTSGLGPYVFPTPAYWPAFAWGGTPYGTGNVYGGGYYPVYGGGFPGWRPTVCN